MKNLYNASKVILVFSAFTFIGMAHSELPKVIYGNDDRYEVEEYHDRLYREYAKSVAGKVAKFKLRTDPSDESSYTFSKRKLGVRNNLCLGVRYREQNTLPTCSGFLIAPNLIATAGHCVRTKFDCKNSYWVFDYVESTKSIPKKNVFNCKKIPLCQWGISNSNLYIKSFFFV